MYLYRAVDKQGRTVDILLSERRDAAAAKRFFRKIEQDHRRIKQRIRPMLGF